MRADRLNNILHCVKDDAEVSVDVHGTFYAVTAVKIAGNGAERIVIICEAHHEPVDPAK